jgi:hypothetical protein
MDTGAFVVTRYVTTDLQTTIDLHYACGVARQKRFTAMLPRRRMTRYGTTNFHENDSSM